MTPPMFQKRHFEAIARVIRADLDLTYDQYHQQVVSRLARSLADMLARDNQHFDHGRFFIACGLGR